MIAPRARLVVWTTILGLPLGVLAAARPGWASLGGVLWLLAICSDALMAWRRLAAIEIDLPERVRLTTGQAGHIEALLHGVPAGAHGLSVGLPLAADLVASERVVSAVPVGRGDAKVRWQCRPRARGGFALDSCFIELVSLLGYWSARSRRRVTVEVKVYPGLLSERRRLAAFFLRHGAVGRRAQRQIGQGRELEQLREYQPGDAYADIHWKATAKRRQPVTKVFQVERAQEIYVLIDGSRLALRATGEEQLPLLERFIAAGLLLALAAERQGDRFGLIAFHDRVERYLPARNGLDHFQSCREVLSTFAAQRVSPDFEELSTFARSRLGRRALLLVLTDLQDPMAQQEFLRGLKTLVPHHLVDIVMPKPPGVAELFSDDDVESTEQVYERLGGHLMLRGLLELRRELGHRNTYLSLVDDERLGGEVLARYGALKQRQAL